MFEAGAVVDVVGTSKGKGTAGVMKRHGFKGLGASHGTQRKHRSPGSIGGCATPGRVFKGLRMAGRMGNARVTTQNLTVHRVDAENGLLLIKGAVPGPRGGLLLVEDALQKGGVGMTSSIEVQEPPTAVPTGDGTVELPAHVFDVPANIPLMHQVVVAQLAAARQGTHSTKTRGEVRGGGRKPYRQKGTGRARQGSTRAPQFAGGGISHGPTPRDYTPADPEEDEGRRPARCAVRPGPRRRGARRLLASSTATRRPRRRRARSLEGLHRARERACSWSSAATTSVSWLSLRNLPNVHVLVAGPAQHLRRAGQRRRAVHQRRAGDVPRRPDRRQPTRRSPVAADSRRRGG